MRRNMSSSGHVSDGLRQAAAKAPEKSNFLQTCNLLSRYIKEKGSLRDLNLEIGGKVESLDAIVKPGSSLSASSSAAANSKSHGNPGKSAKQTIPQQQPSMLDSCPQVSRPDSSSIIPIDDDSTSKTSSSKEGTITEPKHSQLTIFYSGRVLVFDDYPADKARELVSIAKRSSSQMSYGILLPNSNITQEKPNPSPREGLPPRPSKQTVGSSLNTYNKEKSNLTTSGAPGAREGLPPRPQPASGKQLVGIPSDGMKEKAMAGASEAPDAVASSSNEMQEQASPAQSGANGSDLPIARRSSIHRFLEKRKDRTAARGPYHNQDIQGAGSGSSKGDEQLDLNF